MADYTPNIGLHQWQASDNFLRTDFNEDLAKLDAEVYKGLQCYQAAPYMGYNLCDTLLRYRRQHSDYVGYPGILLSDFRNSQLIQSITEGVSLQNNVLTLTGAGKSGTVTFLNISTQYDWGERVYVWVRHGMKGEASVTINGTELVPDSMNIKPCSSGIQCIERGFTAPMHHVSAAQLVLNLSTGTAEQMEVYEYAILFL